MPVYNIADLKVSIDPVGETLLRQAKKYLSESNDPDIIIEKSTETELMKFRGRISPFSLDSADYLLTGSKFALNLIDYNGLMLHSSAVAYENKAYLFSADCGVGKSTHTSLWQKVFGEDNAKIINDDKPVIRKIDGIYYAYGSPFSGKNDKSLNIRVPIKAICFIERAAENSIMRITSDESVGLVYRQIMRPCRAEKMNMLLDFMDMLIREIPIYKLKCNISQEAVHVAYNAMKG